MQNQLLDIPQENQLLEAPKNTSLNIATSTIQQSRFRFGLVIVLSLIFWAAVFYLLYDAFSFIDSMHAKLCRCCSILFFCPDGNDDFFNWHLITAACIGQVSRLFS